MAVCRHGLRVINRTLIEVWLADVWTIRATARVLDRSPGMVSDEVVHHGNTACYAAQAVQAQAATARSRCGRKPKLGAEDALLADVADLRHLGWSPEQSTPHACCCSC